MYFFHKQCSEDDFHLMLLFLGKGAFKVCCGRDSGPSVQKTTEKTTGRPVVYFYERWMHTARLICLLCVRKIVFCVGIFMLFSADGWEGAESFVRSVFGDTYMCSAPYTAFCSIRVMRQWITNTMHLIAVYDDEANTTTTQWAYLSYSFF